MHILLFPSNITLRAFNNLGTFIFKISKSNRYMKCLDQIVLSNRVLCVIASDSERTIGLHRKEIAWDLVGFRISAMLS